MSSEDNQVLLEKPGIEDSFHKIILSAYNWDRSYQRNEYWENFNQQLNPSEHQRTQLPENYYNMENA